MFGTADSLWVVRTGGQLIDAEQLVDGGREFEGESEAVVGGEGGRASSQGNVVVDEDVGGAFGVEFSSSDGKHVGAAAEAVGEMEDAGVSKGCEGQRSGKVNSNDEASSIHHGNSEHWSPDGLTRRLRAWQTKRARTRHRTERFMSTYH